MSNEKINIIEKSAEQYKKLPPEKKMFVLGIMQGILISQSDKKSTEVSKQEVR